MLVGEYMGSKSVTVIIFVIVAIVAIAVAGVFAAMTGTYSLNLVNGETRG